MEAMLQHFSMGGYGFYVWTAYASALIVLGIQWIIPWRRWKKYLRDHS